MISKRNSLGQIEAYNISEMIRAFNSHIDKGGPNECWIWSGARDSNNPTRSYGRFRVNGVNTVAHKVSWELIYGKVPKDKLVLHKCNNPVCVNPNHLYLGFQTDNMKDMILSGRSPNPPKLYDEEIWLVRKLLNHGLTGRLIAKMFKVSESVISSIKNNPKYSRSKGPIDYRGAEQGNLVPIGGGLAR